MVERKLLTISTFSHDKYGDAGDWPDKLLEFREWLDERIAEIPEEHRADAAITLQMEHGYYDDPATMEFSIWYQRPETDAELAERLDKEESDRKRAAAESERRERAALAALKRKYEP